MYYFASEQEAKDQPPSPPAVKKETKKSRSSKSSKKSTPAVTEDKKEAIKSVVFTGKTPVDDSCPIKNQVHNSLIYMW